MGYYEFVDGARALVCLRDGCTFRSRTEDAMRVHQRAHLMVELEKRRLATPAASARGAAAVAARADAPPAGAAASVCVAADESSSDPDDGCCGPPGPLEPQDNSVYRADKWWE